MMLSKAQELILIILDRAKQEGMENLSKFQLMKLVYLIETEALKYSGTFFVKFRFIRDANGPISIDTYNAIDELKTLGLINVYQKSNPKYGHDRICHKMIKSLPEIKNFSKDEVLFIDSVLSDYLPLTQNKLQKVAYSTEPMQAILKEENGKILKGKPLDMNLVNVHEDVMESIEYE